MRATTPLRRRLAVAAAGAVAASTLLGISAPAQAAAPTPTFGTTVDYFDDVYPALDAGSVFETVTIERFEWILKNATGNVAFLIGDPKNTSTQATIGHVQKVAKAQGITKIYNFTPKIDGDKLNVWDLAGSGLNQAGRTYFGAVGDRLVTDYLSKDQQTPFTKNASTDPYLFVYDKDRTVSGQEDRIVSALSGTKTAADLDTPAEVAAYEAQVQSVLGAVPANQILTTSNFDFQKAEVNRRHTTTAAYSNPTTHGGNIIEDSDAADGFRIQTLTYPELVNLLQKPGDIPILFGGTWCHNTRAIIKFVNADAQKYGVKTVYNFDFSLFSTSNAGTNYDHIRDNPVATTEDGVLKVTRPSNLYGDLVNTYLTNATTEYRTVSTQAGASGVSPVNYYPGGDTTKELKQARKIQVGHFLTYNKDHKDALGNPAPVVDQAIRENNDGGNTEHMTEWWYTAGRDLGDAAPLNGPYNVSVETARQQLQNQRNFAKEGLDEIDGLFKGLVGQGLSTTTVVTGASGTVSEGATPTLAVSVGAASYAPFISLNTASGLTAGVTSAPSTAVGKPRGTVALFDGSTQLAEARVKRDGTAAFVLSPQTRGTKSLTVKYLGRGDLLEPSQKTVSYFVGDASTTTLADVPARAFGAGTTTTATVTPGATGTVSLDGLPGAAIEGTITGGSATLAIPASTPAGTYSVTASYQGDATYGTSTSEARTLTITKAPTTVASTVTNGTYGSPASVGVVVTGPAGHVPTGSVTVTAGGTSQTVPVDGQGRASVSLPTTLAPKDYAVTTVYSGDGNLIASSGFGRVTIAKGATKPPAFAAKGSLKAKKNGKASVNVSTPTGQVKATGKVRIQLKKGSATKTVTVTLSSGRATVKLPKLAKGTWAAKVTYLGDANYVPTKTVSIAKKLKVKG